jgi:hypothetical protein
MGFSSAFSPALPDPGDFKMTRIVLRGAYNLQNYLDIVLSGNAAHFTGDKQRFWFSAIIICCLSQFF